MNEIDVEDKLKLEIVKYEKFSKIFPLHMEIINYWFNQGKEFPLLSIIAKNVFIIPASSSEIERRFSQFNSMNVVSKKRNRLNKDRVDEIMMMLEKYKKYE